MGTPYASGLRCSMPTGDVICAGMCYGPARHLLWHRWYPRRCAGAVRFCTRAPNCQVAHEALLLRLYTARPLRVVWVHVAVGRRETESDARAKSMTGQPRVLEHNYARCCGGGSGGGGDPNCWRGTNNHATKFSVSRISSLACSRVRDTQMYINVRVCLNLGTPLCSARPRLARP